MNNKMQKPLEIKIPTHRTNKRKNQKLMMNNNKLTGEFPESPKARFITKEKD